MDDPRHPYMNSPPPTPSRLATVAITYATDTPNTSRTSPLVWSILPPGESEMTMQKVSQAAIEARVRRAVAEDGLFLRKPRNAVEQRELGHYILVSARTGYAECWTSDLAELARECGVIRTNEVIEE